MRSDVCFAVSRHPRPHLRIHVIRLDQQRPGAFPLHLPPSPPLSASHRAPDHARQVNLFTGDTLLIGGCGRSDFQSGSAEALYHSIKGACDASAWRQRRRHALRQTFCTPSPTAPSCGLDTTTRWFTRHTSHVTRHTSHVTRHTSHVTRHTSHVTRHTSHVTRMFRAPSRRPSPPKKRAIPDATPRALFQVPPDPRLSRRLRTVRRRMSSQISSPS